MNNLYELGMHNIESSTYVLNNQVFDKLKEEYFNANEEEIKEMWLDGYMHDDTEYLAEFIEVDYEEFKTLSDDEIISKLLKHFDIYDDRVSEDVIGEVYKMLDEEYEECTEDVDTIIDKKIEEFKSKLPEGCMFKHSVERSHSWRAGRYPSEYHSIYIENDDKNRAESYVIRICDGHSNNNYNNYQINFHWFDLDSFEEDLDITLDNLIEYAKDF